MKAHATRFDNRRRPPWWSALLSLFVSLSLMLSPAQLCALMEMAPGHAHVDGLSHAATAPHTHSHDGHSHEAAPHDDHSHAGATHQASHQATLQSVPQAHECCLDMKAPPVVAVGISRFTAPGSHSAPATYALAVLPAPLDIFALTNCHGRDGLLDETLHSQLSRASLLGRAPPVSV